MNSYYDATVPVFIRMLQNLSEILQKAALFAAEKGMSEGEMLEGRLAPDQFALLKQIQVSADNAKNGAARLAGVEAPTFADDEKTVAELVERLDKTITYLQTFTSEQFTESAARKITLPYFPGKYIAGDEYVHYHLLPNFFFHVVTAYGIIRHLSVPLGKGDYLKGLVLKDL